MFYIYEHADSGVLLQVDYTPAKTGQAIVINEVHACGPDYKPTGPNLAVMLHDSFTLNTSTTPALATRMLETIAKELACQKH